MSAPEPPAQDGDLAGKLAALAGARVAVVGDVMLDRFVTGTVERVSPEAPIPVLKVGRSTAMLGGAGNVLRNLAALGAQPRLVAAVGDDEPGDQVAALAEQAAPGAAGLIELPGRATSVKVRYLAGGQQLLRTDWEDTAALPDAAAERLFAAAAAALDQVQVLVLSDYGKGVLTPAATARLIDAARQRGVSVIVDPKAKDYAAYAGADLVTPNRAELARATDRDLPDAGGADADGAVEAGARALIRQSGVAGVLATRGAHGMTLVEHAEAAVRHLPAAAREVYDVSGAGDTVVAALAAARAGGLSLADAARIANVAAGIVVGKVGTAVARPDELLRALHAQRLLQAEAKVASRDTAVERVAAWHRGGLKVAFTNGCFDLLHPGHVSLLEQARGSADRLVVGLNADASVRRLKGDGRPVQDEAARAAVLASLASVDLVVLFEEDTPLDLLRALKPDVLVKGADYTRDTVVGADLVESYGGRVALADLSAGHSTTATLARLRGQGGGQGGGA
ncbi:bifunctional heptose 7-phosphate kinase/heptose 1-phosphate adenyltransferase [Rhodovibrio sodomensis]|uniref:Bifunctional protein HldE n=1 Tax=Rhodovibrio sodomensis TaxID=1088 RepID=A0ABS1DLN9_9PROT|nr:D-glycero-beta-D-manno-heptose-7-phosphate kinase [Rhodovibrio sodomensis]MBK1670867.1 bifunctional heptose 7-phosphate kinase/heptose 1-phosphate adenyltransferase [Rhodovibrio sodomensis]